MKPIPRHRLLLALILLAGLSLRLFRIGADSLWYDETVSVSLAGSRLPELLRHTAGDIHPPGYYLLLRGWLIVTGYPTGHADPAGIGLEFAAGFFSLCFGVLLIALVYALARHIAGHHVALIAAALVALSPYNVWYSQEARMYTLAAGLEVIVVYALLQATSDERRTTKTSESAERAVSNLQSPTSSLWWAIYALAAAAGMYTLYYFAFLLIPLNLWALWRLTNDERRTTHHASRITSHASRITHHASRTTHPISRLAPLLLANLAAALLYAPWLPIAFRQAVDPPVPPWRTAPNLLAALAESWTALSLGQSAPGWLWPVLVLTLGLYALGLLALVTNDRRRTTGDKRPATDDERPMTNDRRPSAQHASRTTHHASYHQPSAINHPPSAIYYLPIATFGPLLLILAVSVVTPLYHVRYLFTYSPAFYVVLAAGLGWLLSPRGRAGGEAAVSEIGAEHASPERSPALCAGRSRRMRPSGCPLRILRLRGGQTTATPLRMLWLRGGRWRGLLAHLIVAAWLIASAATLHAFWLDPRYRGDDHRAAVRFLQEHWRPGDVVLVNAGYAYTALLTYWDGPVAFRGRLTDALPAPRADAGLLLVTTGHVDGDAGLGWADPRSDFFALPAAVAERQIATLFERFPRVWHYRIYDTVNDPSGQLRGWLEENGRLFEERVFAGEANMRVQGFVPRRGAVWSAGLPTYRYAAGVSVQLGPAAVAVEAGDTLYGSLTWRADAPGAAPFATSLRLIGGDGDSWAQPPDERPLGSQFGPGQWPVGAPQRQPFAVTIPPGTPPGEYTLALLVYDPITGKPWPPQDHGERLVAVQDGLNLGRVTVRRPPQQELRPLLAGFGPLALIAATSPATTVAPGGQIPLELLWQAASAPGEALIVVVQLLGPGDRLAANLEEQSTRGLYPTDRWVAGELVRDRHTLGLPADLPPGDYRLIVGVYRAADRTRLKTPAGLFAARDHWVVKQVKIRPSGD